MTESYPVKIWNGILKDGHCQKIGNALWEFIWLIDKVTKEENNKGRVLGGKPIQINDIAKELQKSRRTTQRNLKILEDHGYINIKKAPYGISITINKSKKFKSRHDKSGTSRHDKSGTSGQDKYDQRHANYDQRGDKSVTPNRTLNDTKDIKKKKNPRKKKKDGGLSDQEKKNYATGMETERKWQKQKEKPENNYDDNEY